MTLWILFKGCIGCIRLLVKALLSIGFDLNIVRAGPSGLLEGAFHAAAQQEQQIPIPAAATGPHHGYTLLLGPSQHVHASQPWTAARQPLAEVQSLCTSWFQTGSSW